MKTYSFNDDEIVEDKDGEWVKLSDVQTPEWLPIETAPEGVTFLAVTLCGNIQQIYTMRKNVADGMNRRDDGIGFTRERVTHWMPLPAAPKPDCSGAHHSTQVNQP